MILDFGTHAVGIDTTPTGLSAMELLAYKAIRSVPEGFGYGGVATHPDSGKVGILCRNFNTRIFSMWDGAAMSSVPQDWAEDKTDAYFGCL